MLSARIVPAAALAIVAALALAMPALSKSRPRDRDRDGLSDRHERRATHTHPRRADTDGDGLSDRFELRRSHTNPRRRDTDRDGLRDLLETRRLRTNPRRADTDNDGQKDAYEVRQAFTNPRTSDSDGDGSNDALEVLVRTGPRSKADQKPRLIVPAPSSPLPTATKPTPSPPAPKDKKPPQTSIDSGPSGTVANASASFTFSSSEAGSSFQCRLDGGAWAACTSPKAYSGLASGSHTFAVRATDAAGNTDATAASRTWTVSVPPTPPPPPPPPPPVGGVIRVAPGGDITAAYNQAQAGDVIELACGLHGKSRSLSFQERPGSWTTPSGTKRVTIRSETPQCAKLRQLINRADNITFDGLDLDAQGTQTNWAVFESGGRQNVTLKNSRVGNVVDEKGAMLGGSSSTAPTNLLIDNVVFRDVRQVTAGVHNECVFSQAPGLTIRNSTFTNCATMDLFVVRGDWWGQPPYGNVTLESNVFGHSRNGSGWHYYGLYWSNGAGLRNARVVNNTFENSVILDNNGSGPWTGVWANNIGGGWSCLAGVTYRNNVGKVCDPSDKAVSPVSSCGPPACSSLITAPYRWANPAAEDFHLLAGSPAIDAGSAQYAPPTDRGGKPRNGLPDAGAYEY